MTLFESKYLIENIPYSEQQECLLLLLLVHDQGNVLFVHSFNKKNQQSNFQFDISACCRLLFTHVGVSHCCYDRFGTDSRLSSIKTSDTTCHQYWYNLVFFVIHNDVSLAVQMMIHSIFGIHLMQIQLQVNRALWIIFKRYSSIIPSIYFNDDRFQINQLLGSNNFQITEGFVKATNDRRRRSLYVFFWVVVVDHFCVFRCLEAIDDKNVLHKERLLSNANTIENLPATVIVRRNSKTMQTKRSKKRKRWIIFRVKYVLLVK